MKPNCRKCAWFVEEDFGYSNYTVEETQLDCLLSKNPHLPATESYNWETDMNGVLIVEDCSCFLEGTPIKLDVDREEGQSLVDYATHPTVKGYLTLTGKTERWQSLIGE